MRKNPEYLSFIRKQPCLFCGADAEPHHVRSRLHTPPKWRGGTGLKPYDYACLPVCRSCHQRVHDGHMTIENPHWKIMELLGEYIMGV